ncbi:MAG: response regulator [Chloroflexota bacterium]|nr:response regulator [Chloroflexota bacterium]
MIAPNEFNFKNVCALAVEDDAGGMAIIGVMLRYLGIKAYINTNGIGVVEMAHAMKPPPTIILLDINLPKTNGYEVLKQIRADETFKGILVIAMTAQDADTEIPKAKAAGFDGFVGKPLSRSRFPRQLRRILNGEAVWETY